MIDANQGRRLVGRDADVMAATENIRSGNGTWIVAESGLGKSALATAVLQELADDVRPFRIHASRTFSSVPYGALAPLLTNLTAQQLDSHFSTMRTLTERLQADTAGLQPALLVVDNAHDLDARSAEILGQLVASMQVKALLLSRPSLAEPPTLLGEAVEGLLHRRSLEPLSERQVHQLCNQVLGGETAASASAILARASGGNPLFLLSLLDQARQAGRLVQTRGVWLLRDVLPEADVHLSELIERELSELSADEREVLDFVALLGAVPLTVIFECGNVQAIDRLMENGLIEISPPPEPRVWLRNPVHARALPALVPVFRRLRLYRKMEEVLPGGGSGEMLFRRAKWALDSGVQLPDDELVKAAITSNNAGETALAVRSAGAVLTVEFRWAAQLQRARAMCPSDPTSGPLIEELVAAAGNAEQAREAALLAAQWPHPLHKWMHRNLEAWSAGAERVPTRSDSAPGVDQAGMLDRSLRLLELRGLVTDGGYTAASGPLAALVAEASIAQDLECQVVAGALLAQVYTVTGRADSAIGETTKALQALQMHEPRVASREFVVARHIIALLTAGRWDDAAEAVAEFRVARPNGLVHLGGTVDLAAAIILGRRGDYAEAYRKLAGAAGELEHHDPLCLRPVALAVGAYLAMLNGQDEQAGQYLSDYAMAETGSATPSGLFSGGVAAAARLLQFPGTKALSELQSLADIAGNRGWSSLELALRFLAIQLGDMGRIGQVGALAASLEGSEAALAALYCEAADTGGVEQLVHTAEEVHSSGLVSLGLHTLSEALRIAKAVRNRTAQRRINALLGQWQEAAPVARDVPSSTSLTRRERDIAALVIAGKRNAEIAEALSLSVRTVEGHIYRMFEKLGINRREQLGREHL